MKTGIQKKELDSCFRTNDEKRGRRAKMADQEKIVNRRQFFKAAFVAVTEKAAEISGEGQRKVPKKRNYLRPPGAVEEALFLSLCTLCDECIKACPHNCIKRAERGMGTKTGTPIIVPKEVPCRLCTDLPCINACKDGALRPVEDLKKVRMGAAVIDRTRCLDYTEEQFSLCQQCYRHCPFPDEAIYLEEERPVIRGEKCVGCGICENVCQAVNPPSAIRVFPVPTGL